MEDRMKVSAGFYLMLTAMLMVLPLSWLVAMFFSACIHELGHYAAIRFFTGKESGAPALRQDGASIELPEMSGWQELICALSGPIAGMCLLIGMRYMPRVALCAAIQSAYNLIPLYPRDGGRALRALLRMVASPKRAERICRYVEWICIFLLLLFAVCLICFLEFGLIPAMFVVWDLIWTKKSLKTDRIRSTIVPSCE